MEIDDGEYIALVAQKDHYKKLSEYQSNLIKQLEADYKSSVSEIRHWTFQACINTICPECNKDNPLIKRGAGVKVWSHYVPENDNTIICPANKLVELLLSTEALVKMESDI